MREYEALVVLSPELDDDGVNAVVESVSTMLDREGGEMLASGQLANAKGDVAIVKEGWRIRKLAYQIGGHSEGYFVVMRFKAEADAPQDLERRWKLDENVLRHMVMRLDEHFAPPMPTVRAQAEPERPKAPPDEGPPDRPPEEGELGEPSLEPTEVTDAAEEAAADSATADVEQLPMELPDEEALSVSSDGGDEDVGYESDEPEPDDADPTD